MKLRGLLARPHVSRRAWMVWRRNRDVFTKTIAVNFIPPMAEPIIYLAAFGFGVGSMFSSGARDYALTLAPALIAITVMNASFFECTFASFVRMYFQRTFDAIVATPLNVDEVIIGEMLWGATRSMISAVIMMAVIALFGLVQSIWIILVLPFAFFGGLLFAAIGMCFTAITPKIENFNYPTSLFIVPITFVSDTFFPLAKLPSALQSGALVFDPLLHVVRIFRGFAAGNVNVDMLWSFLWIVAVTGLFFLLAINLMKRRLIV